MAIKLSKDRIKLPMSVINAHTVKILLLLFFISCGGVKRDPAINA